MELARGWHYAAHPRRRLPQSSNGLDREVVSFLMDLAKATDVATLVPTVIEPFGSLDITSLMEERRRAAAIRCMGIPIINTPESLSC